MRFLFLFFIFKYLISFFLKIISIENGIIYSWGYNEYGQLGLNKITEKELIPSQISISESFQSISCGAYHTIAISSIFLIFYFQE